MKILQIHNKYRHYGGEDAVVDNEFKLLVKRGQEVRQLLFDNSKISAVKLFHNSESFSKVMDEIQDFKPDIIHIHNLFYYASPSILKAAKKAEVPVVMTIHNYRLLCTGALFLRDGKSCIKCKDLMIPYHGIRHKCFQGSLSKSAVLSSFIAFQKVAGTWKKYVDRFIVLTPFIKEIFLDSSLHLEPVKVVVKPNSTDDVFEQQSEISTRNGYLFVGRLSIEKGVRTLVEAFNMMPQISLSIIGDGELQDALKKKAGQNIKFYGKKDKEFIVGMLKSSRALIFPSIWYEGLPNTVIEAFSSRTPVIASDMNNINQLVSAGRNGELFEVNNAGALSKAVMDFEHKDTSGYEDEARKTFLNYYTHEQNFKNLIEIYRSLLE